MADCDNRGDTITIDIKDLEKKANWVRRRVLDMIISANKGHIGGTLSCTDILVTLYYGNILKYDYNNPNWEERDRFILSKGHSCPALYAILADIGFFPIFKLESFCQQDSILGGHPNRNIPGIEIDSGSLGHGLGIATGIALCAKIDKKNYKTVVLLGDCECHEGSVWEGIMFAGHHRLNNLVVIVDYNQQCVTDFTKDSICLEPFSDKWRAFNWEVRTINGHSFSDILRVFNDFRTYKISKPLVVIADTIKGKGISFMERGLTWHHSIPTDKQLEMARKELLKNI